ncbi:MAG TPA: hypothetical protein V6D22_17620 [Candidatus Obscuribacterales bacterium]
MFHYKLIELESELIAKEQSQKGFALLPPECSVLLEFIQQEIGAQLAMPVNKDWKGWLSYRRNKDSLVICRGRSFKDGMLGKYKAGLNVANGLDTITEYQRGFDVSPPQELDHLLLNFGGDADRQARVFLWYGENIAPYKLIFMADVETDPHAELVDAMAQACTWILTRPKDQTLTQFLASHS